MNTLKLTAIVFTLLLSACGTTRAEVTEWNDVAEQLVDSRNVALTAFALRNSNGTESAGATWFSVCEAKECSAEAVQYSRVFRESALHAEAVRQAEGLMQSGLAESFGIDGETTRALSNRIAVLRLELDRMTPESDLAPESRERGERGLRLAMEQLQFAAEHIRGLEGHASNPVAIAAAR